MRRKRVRHERRVACPVEVSFFDSSLLLLVSVHCYVLQFVQYVHVRSSIFRVGFCIPHHPIRSEHSSI